MLHNLARTAAKIENLGPLNFIADQARRELRAILIIVHSSLLQASQAPIRLLRDRIFALYVLGCVDNSAEAF